ncbi:MAG: hypothetical protein EU547_00110 [Promethearchaeota archaeon]|nr:MAG: hypothetical protein EU547_00110 [Candidatus Lokiarchaeota archaeon]
MNLRNLFKSLIKKIKDFSKDQTAGSFIEYALLLGFGLFLFLLIFGATSSIMDWTLGLKDEFFGLFG